ncbi:MAG TPA: potassium-transporting ATPase subunit C, partial [Prolixibacteraceae bacterium]
SGSELIPSEMLYTSASGLDPHISPEAAILQVDRIANARRFDPDKKQQLLNVVTELTEAPQFTFLGENRINVLRLNIELDQLDHHLNTSLK